MADDWHQVGKRGRGLPVAPARGGSPARGLDRGGGGRPHHRGGHGRGRGRGNRGRGGGDHSHKPPTATGDSATKKNEHGDHEEGSSGSEELEYSGQLLLADDSPDEGSMSDEPPSPAAALVASSSRKAEEQTLGDEVAEEEEDNSDVDEDDEGKPVQLPRRDEPLQDVVRKRLGLTPTAAPLVLEVQLDLVYLCTLRRECLFHYLEHALHYRPARHRNYVCDKCKRCTEFTARRRGREVTCANCGCDVLSHLQDEDEADADVEDRDYAPEYADVD